MNEKLNIFIALKIYEYYPYKLGYMSVYDKKTDKYSAGVFAINESDMTLGNILYSLDEFFNDEYKAIKTLMKIVEEKMELVKTMCN